MCRVSPDAPPLRAAEHSDVRSLSTAIAAAALLAVPASASAAHGKSDYAVKSVQAARSATAGIPLDVSVRVSRTRRAPAAGLRFYLTADRKRVRLAGGARLKPGRARVVQTAARPLVPTGQPVGDYRLTVCVDIRDRNKRNNCRAMPLKITAEPVGTRELVAAAVAAGKLTPQQGLLYRVYAAFGDRRLPAAYAGDASEPEHGVLREAISAWPRLSAGQRAKLSPFFTPPAAKRSQATGAAARSGPNCVSNQLANHDWRSIAKPGGHVRVWWLPGDERPNGPKARSLAYEIENVMWPKLQSVFGREPLPDGRERCWHGIDSKLDIYLQRLDRGRALTVAYPPRCTGTPAFIVFSAGLGPPSRWEVAHELTHAFQYAYHVSGPCDSYAKWDEAVANWGAQFVYPHDNVEHADRWLLRDPQRSLADSDYEGWVFPYAMEQLHGAGTIRSIYEQTERRGVLEAIDAGVPGGLATAWPDFARLAWNQEPAAPSFLQWDDYDQVPEKDGAPIPAEQVDPGYAGQTEVDMPLTLAPLTRAYRHFKFGPGVTEITVEKPSYPGLTLQGLIRTRSGRWRTEDWSRRQPVYCPQAPGDRPAELVLVLSNNSLTQASPQRQAVKLLATNIGCSRYTGEASGSTSFRTPNDSIDESWHATDLVYTRFNMGIELPRFLFRLTGGKVTWSLSGTQYNCTVKAGPVTLPLESGGYNGAMDITASISSPTWARRYYAQGIALPSVKGTATCPNVGTVDRWFSPHSPFLSTSGMDHRRVPPDGILQGTETRAEGSGRTSSYTWRLVPDR